MRVVLAVVAVLAVTGLALAQEAPPSTPPQPPAAPEQPPPQVPPAPPPGAAIPSDPGDLAASLETAHDALYFSIDGWLADGDPARGGAPVDVARWALYRQRIVLRLVRARALYEKVLGRLPQRLRPSVRDDVLAKRELAAIHSVVVQRPRIRIGRAEPAGRLLSHYRRAQRRFAVGWPLLAAVNLVETAFGRMRNESVSGARGPMQFMPATWRAYGMGGNVRDPRDAILGAANYLHASGAPGDESRALYAYNPSRLYVRAVSRYARRIRADRRAYYAYYAQQVFLRSQGGYRRASSHGLR